MSSLHSQDLSKPCLFINSFNTTYPIKAHKGDWRLLAKKKGIQPGQVASTLEVWRDKEPFTAKGKLQIPNNLTPAGEFFGLWEEARVHREDANSTQKGTADLYSESIMITLVVGIITSSAISIHNHLAENEKCFN